MTKTTIQATKRKDCKKVSYQYSTTLPKQIMEAKKARNGDLIEWDLDDRGDLIARVRRR